MKRLKTQHISPDNTDFYTQYRDFYQYIIVSNTLRRYSSIYQTERLLYQINFYKTRKEPIYIQKLEKAQLRTDKSKKYVTHTQLKLLKSLRQSIINELLTVL